LRPGALDRALMASLLRLSSSEAARTAAAAWLEAFDAARATGQPQARADALAQVAWRAAMGEPNVPSG
jgi:hypothetical protein